MEYSQQIQKLEYENSLDMNEQISQKWINVLGNNYDIYISNVYKPDNGCLGISLECAIHIENDREIHTCHYINIVLPDGIIGKEGILKPGDQLLEVNNEICFGKNHIYVIEHLKAIKHQIKLVCARRKIEQLNEINLTTISQHSYSTFSNETSQVILELEELRKQWLEGSLSLNDYLIKLKQLVNKTTTN